MSSLKFEQARQYAEERLARELSPDLVYHGIAHTREEVVPAVETLAALEGMKGNSLILLRTAAWFHDLGYVENAIDHESISARIAGEILPSFGYNRAQVEIIKRAIFATVLPQSPTSKLEEILVDADLDVLGREDFMRRNHDLRSELAWLGQAFTDAQWYSRQLNFLEGHRYFTAAAQSLRDRQKQQNIITLRKKLDELRLK